MGLSGTPRRQGERMKIIVDNNELENNIMVRLSGEDLRFNASPYSICLFLDDKAAQDIAFKIEAMLQDKEIGKKVNE